MIMNQWAIITDKTYLMIVIIIISILIIAMTSILKIIIINRRLKDINTSIKKMNSPKE